MSLLCLVGMMLFLSSHYDGTETPNWKKQHFTSAPTKHDIRTGLRELGLMYSSKPRRYSIQTVHPCNVLDYHPYIIDDFPPISFFVTLLREWHCCGPLLSVLNETITVAGSMHEFAALLFRQSKPLAQSLKHGAVFCGVRPTASFLSYVGGITHARLPEP